MAGLPLRVNPDQGPSDPSVRKVISLCDMHGIHCGSSADLPAFMQALGGNKHLAMDFWSLVASITDQAGTTIPLQALNGHILELVISAVSGHTVAEMIAAGSDQRRLVGDLGGLLAGEDIAATPTPTEPPAPVEPEATPDDDEVEKLRAEFEDLRAAFEARFGAARYGAPMTRQSPQTSVQLTPAPAPPPPPAPRLHTEPPRHERPSEPRALRPAIAPVPPPHPQRHDQIHDLPEPVQHESEPYSELDIAIPPELEPYRKSPPTPPAAASAPTERPITSPATKPLSPQLLGPLHHHAPSFAAALASASIPEFMIEPPQPKPQPDRIRPDAEKNKGPYIEKDNDTVTNSATDVTSIVHQPSNNGTPQPLVSEPDIFRAFRIEAAPTPAPVQLPLRHRRRRIFIVPLLATLLFILACLVAYFAERAGFLTMPTIPAPVAAKLPPWLLQPFTQATTQAKTVDVDLPVPDTSAVTPEASPASLTTPTRQQPTTPLTTGPGTTTTFAHSTASTKPEPDIDKGLNTKAIIHSDSKASDAGAPPKLATNLTGMARVPPSGIVSLSAAAPSIKAAPIVTPPAPPLKVSSGVMQGAKISGPNPEYPAWARTAHVFGDVVLAATITRNGDVTKLSVVSGPVGLRDAAMAAVSKWKYRPYRLNGDPIEVQTNITVKFNLENGVVH